MRGAVIHAPGDVRFENLDDPKVMATGGRIAVSSQSATRTRWGTSTSASPPR
jgi:hypothetical protein